MLKPEIEDGQASLADPQFRADVLSGLERRPRAIPARWFYDWGGGLIWLATDASDDAGAAVIRAAVKAAGTGHATLVRAPEATRAAVPVFEPLPEPLMRITAGIKAAHDPAGIFNPGRMYAGI